MQNGELQDPCLQATKSINNTGQKQTNKKPNKINRKKLADQPKKHFAIFIQQTWSEHLP